MEWDGIGILIWYLTEFYPQLSHPGGGGNKCVVFFFFFSESSKLVRRGAQS